MARYELSEGSSNKFWQIELTDTSFTTSYGRIGTNGQSTTKSFQTADKARIEHDKLIAEKVAKGYQLVGGSGPATPVSSAAATPAAAPKAAAPRKTAPAAAEPIVATESPATPAVSSDPAAPVLTWTPALTSTAKQQRAAIAVKPLQVGDAPALYEKLQTLFRLGAEPALTLGLERTETHRDRLINVLTTYSERALAPELNIEVEADALRLLPPVLKQHVQRQGVTVEGLLIDLWVAHAGLPFALRAFVASLAPVGAKFERSPEAVWLRDQANRSVTTLLADRTDLRLRGHLLATDDAGEVQALLVAHELRQGASLVVRAALSSIFLQPTWIDVDLQERVATGAPAPFTELALLNAGTASPLAAYFSTLSLDEAQFLNPLQDYWHKRPAFSIALLERFKQAAIEPLAHWMQRANKLSQESHSRELLFTVNDLLEALTCASNSTALLDAAIGILHRFGGKVLSKNEDPTPAAIAVLRRSPHLALPRLLEAAKQKEAAWARDLLPQFERLCGVGAAANVEEASADELPSALDTLSKLKAPDFWTPAAFRRPLTASGKAFPVTALQSLGALLAKSDAGAIDAIKQSSRPASLAAFAWDLFQAWLSAGAPSKEKWAFLALGLLGDDESARQLTPLLRAWPGESAHQRAVLGLDVLGEIGTDVALMMLNGIAEKVKFKGLQERAREKMEQIAKKRGLTAEELADRLVPDLGLEADGSKTLNFGPRSFRVGFDEALAPHVTDAAGVRQKDLPKPNSKDDAELAAAAVDTWKAMKKDARTLASLQILRLELAMGNERRWSAADFNAFLVHHPLLFHIVRRLLWGTFNQAGELTATFRVAEDRTYADHNDELFTAPAGARVGVAHRLTLTDEAVSAWSKLFGDYELMQPFPQLSREVFAATANELQGKALSRFQGRVIETKKLLGLQNRGWRRGAPQDAGGISYFYKPLGVELNAAIHFDGGLYAGSLADSEPTQKLGEVEFGAGEPEWRSYRNTSVVLSQIPKVVMSEVIRDLESLGTTP